MSAYDWVTRPRDYSSELKESILDIEDATEDHPLLEEDVEDGGDEVRGRCDPPQVIYLFPHAVQRNGTG